MYLNKNKKERRKNEEEQTPIYWLAKTKKSNPSPSAGVFKKHQWDDAFWNQTLDANMFFVCLMMVFKKLCMWN